MSKNKITTFKTPEYLGSYFQNFTPVSSWINWDDHSVDLINFINAFDLHIVEHSHRLIQKNKES